MSFLWLKNNKAGFHVHVDVAAVVVNVSEVSHYPDVVVGQGDSVQTERDNSNRVISCINSLFKLTMLYLKEKTKPFCVTITGFNAFKS